MVYRGHVRDGKIELDGSASLPEGAEVELNIISVSEGQNGHSVPPASESPAASIEEELRRIWADVPDSEWDRLPPDLTDNLDHYIYGTPKK